jgi:Tat protein secretion system quality control protein TatD with DNase activity
VLTETDGPYVVLGARRSAPADVPGLVRDLAGAWSCDADEARQQVWDNMGAVYVRARGAHAAGAKGGRARLTV